MIGVSVGEDGIRVEAIYELSIMPERVLDFTYIRLTVLARFGEVGETES